MIDPILINHTHTHKFEKGTGEELRGYTVCRKTAIEAYTKLLTEFDALTDKYAEQIEAEIDRTKAEYEEISAKYRKEREEVDRENIKIDAEISKAKAKAKGRSLFTGRFREEKYIFRLLDKKLYRSLKVSSLATEANHQALFTASIHSLKSRVRDAASEKLSLFSVVASDQVAVSREDAIEIAQILDGTLLRSLASRFESAYGENEK